MEGMDHGRMKMPKSPAAGAKAGDEDAKAQKKPRAAEHEGHAMPAPRGGGGHHMQADVTRPQLIAVTLFTLLMLTAGMTLPAAFVNLRLSAHDGGLETTKEVTVTVQP